ncbi:hypothetical protein [Streptomyces sp. ICBB 8177]|uniref:hypothetical protein n=1 Tax=Streptomyces sp. ICBB 8177 TaxID=563922 RepID=UPI0011B7212F|nr:hypothetical protein [Streptomyces sp. ICBB 8177]
MSTHAPKPTRMRLNGREIVLLPQEEYERLDASRRQVGAQHTRLRKARQQLDTLEELVAQARALLATRAPHTCSGSLREPEATRPECPACRFLTRSRDEGQPR